jgi:hypothetical protein
MIGIGVSKSLSVDSKAFASVGHDECRESHRFTFTAMVLDPVMLNVSNASKWAAGWMLK